MKLPGDIEPEKDPTGRKARRSQTFTEYPTFRRSGRIGVKQSDKKQMKAQNYDEKWKKEGTISFETNVTKAGDSSLYVLPEFASHYVAGRNSVAVVDPNEIAAYMEQHKNDIQQSAREYSESESIPHEEQQDKQPSYSVPKINTNN